MCTSKCRCVPAEFFHYLLARARALIPIVFGCSKCLYFLAKVEWLIMRAMSLKLVRGVMDEVERLVHVTWVQPRVLEDSQLARLNDRLGEWRGRVNKAHIYVEEQTPELFG